MALTLRLDGPIVGSRGRRAAQCLRVCLSIIVLCAPLSGIDRDRRLDELYHTSWTMKDGAPSEIFAIAQTKDGYLWLGTTTGLVRFDGFRFETYELSFGQALPARNVSSLLAVPDGGLWIGFSSGEVSLLKNGRITSYTPKDGLSSSTVRSLVRDHRGRIWAASLTGLSLFELSRWRRVEGDWNFAGGATAALVDHAGIVWIGTEDRVASLAEGATKFQTAATSVNYVTSLAEAPDGTIWMSQLNGPVRPITPPFTDNVLTDVHSASLKAFFDDRGSLWVPTLGGGFRRNPYPETFDIQKAEPLRLPEQYTRANGLTSDYAETVFQDSEGDIWVGTNAGLDRFRQSAATPVLLPSTAYMSLAPGEAGTLWVASGNADLRLVENRRFMDRLPEEFAPIQRRADCVYRATTGSLWLSTPQELLEMTGRQVKGFAYPQETRWNVDRYGAAVTVTEARPAGMWVSILGHGVYRFANGNWTSLAALGGPSGVAISSFTDPDGHAWLGLLDQSLVRIDDHGIRVFAAQDGVQVGKIRCIQGRDAMVWIGGDSGVARFDGSRFRTLIPRGERLRDVFGILETDEGLWLSEHRGILFVPHSEILAFEKESGHEVSFRVFDFLDGVAAPLQRSTMNPALVQGSNGLLWFASTQGLVFVDPKRIPKSSAPLAVSITSIVANAKTYVPAAALALPETIRNLEIDYIGISLAIPERVRYRYKLEGYDQDWQDPGVRRQAFYTNPGPGSHTFRVIAANPDSVWSESGATIVFSIAPAFYETWWFRLFCVLAAGGAIWMLYLLRLRLVTAQLQARLGDRLLERERIARDLHDTLLQSFQGLMLHLQVVNELLPMGRAKAELEKSLGHADRAIAEGRSAVYDLRSPGITTGDLPESIKALGNEMSAEGMATFRLVVEGAPREMRTMIRDEIYRVVREALRNAFHHAHARHIEAEMSYGGRTFLLRIRDDGQGIPTEILERGRPGHYGLPGMRERVVQIGGKLAIWSGADAGTEIEVSLAASIAYGASPDRTIFRLLRRKQGET